MWHILHSVPWSTNEIEVNSLLRGARLMQPIPKPKRTPILVKDINSIMQNLNLADPLQASAFACLTSTFFACARLGEFTVMNIKEYEPSKHVSRKRVTIIRDIQGKPTVTFFIPKTKTNPYGEYVFWKKQELQCDPEKALTNHFLINNPKPNEHLFSYSIQGKTRPLTQTAFLVTIKKAARKAGVRFSFGHSLRIGGTLEYLLRGVPFEVIKQQGRWKSEAFSLYLRNHAEIISPYLTNSPSIQDKFLNHSYNPKLLSVGGVGQPTRRR